MTMTATSPARDTNGQFARPDAPTAIREVLLPNWRLGYQVGGGRIYASKADALRFAEYRAAKLAN